MFRKRSTVGGSNEIPGKTSNKLSHIVQITSVANAQAPPELRAMLMGGADGSEGNPRHEESRDAGENEASGPAAPGMDKQERVDRHPNTGQPEKVEMAGGSPVEVEAPDGGGHRHGGSDRPNERGVAKHNQADGTCSERKFQEGGTPTMASKAI